MASLVSADFSGLAAAASQVRSLRHLFDPGRDAPRTTMTCLNAHILHHSTFLLGCYSHCDTLKKKYLFSSIRSSWQHTGSSLWRLGSFIAACGLSSCSRWGLLLWCSTGSGLVGFSSCSLWALERRLSRCGGTAQLCCSVVCGIFPD